MLYFYKSAIYLCSALARPCLSAHAPCLRFPSQWKSAINISAYRWGSSNACSGRKLRALGTVAGDFDKMLKAFRALDRTVGEISMHAYNLPVATAPSCAVSTAACTI